MKTMHSILAASLLAFASAAALAQQPDAPKRYLGQFAQKTPICPAGQALTFQVQCDPGSRAPVDRIWSPAAAGVEICRVEATSCQPIPGFNTAARPGFEVQDSPSAGSLAVVSFGVGILLGDEP